MTTSRSPFSKDQLRDKQSKQTNNPLRLMKGTGNQSIGYLELLQRNLEDIDNWKKKQ